MSHLVCEAWNISLLSPAFLLTPVPSRPPISFYLLFSVTLNSCLMRRSRTAKRMNPVGWVPAVALCSASAARSADADVIRYLTAEEPAHWREQTELSVFNDSPFKATRVNGLLWFYIYSFAKMGLVNGGFCCKGTILVLKTITPLSWIKSVVSMGMLLLNVSLKNAQLCIDPLCSIFKFQISIGTLWITITLIFTDKLINVLIAATHIDRKIL